MNAGSFASVFVVFVFVALAWRTWLALRQARHVARHRDEVPADFAALIPLEAHRRAAYYTRDKQRLGMVETLVVDGGDAPAQREREQDRAVDHQRLHQPQALLVARVVGGPAMGFQGDQGGEVRGHGVAVARHVARLAQRQPGAPRERDEHEDHEHRGEGSRVHAFTIGSLWHRTRWHRTRHRWSG